MTTSVCDQASSVRRPGRAWTVVRRRVHRGRRALAALAVIALAGLTASPAEAASYVPITGSGSTWSANALQQWAANVRQSGITVNFSATGSSQGRKDFYNSQVDFAVSEIPYGLTDNGVVDIPPTRGYAYMPIVAGGTSFMYNLKIGTKQVRNLRLSGDTVTKIFTGQIKLWNDPAIKQDNPALTLPARKIIPVVRSDGSGTTAQFTLWMSKQYPSLWNAYCKKAGRSTPCGLTSIYPVVANSGFTAQAGSTQVAGYVAQPSSVGAITYVEYSYAQNEGFPVAKLLNKANYYVSPTAKSVAVALTKAQINKDSSSSSYLTQILDGVYNNADARTYPLSSYSYMIIPTKLEPPLTTDKGYTLGTFAYYFLCGGQQQAPKLGYSPLPINLVQAGFDQVRRIPGVNAQSINIKNCNNPTFSPDGTNTLVKTAPQPPACDKKGQTQCSDTGTPVTGGNGGGSGGGGGGGSGSGGGGSGTGAGTGATGTTPGATSAAAIDPDTGAVISGGDGSSTTGDVSALPVNLAGDYASQGTRKALMALAAIMLIGVTVAPPLLARRLSKGSRT